jgi:hypothetical protein
MKKLVFIAAISLWVIGFSTAALAQVSRNTSCGANIVKGLTLTENTPMHFGSMSVPTAAVSVSLTTSNGRVVSAPANLDLLAQAPMAQNATYTVSGSEAATYAITLPVNGSVTLSSGTNYIDVVNFIARPASTGIDGVSGMLNSTGSDSFTVGATLEMADAQTFGVYSGTFNIAVNYN